jgi:hypothetical protein
MADQQIRLTFSFTEEDVFQSCVYTCLLKNPRRYLLRAIYLLWVGNAIWLAYGSFWHPGISTESLLLSLGLPGVCAAIVGPPFCRILLRIRTKRYIRRNSGIPGECTFECSADTASWKWKYGEATVKWAFFQSVDDTPAYVYLNYRSGDVFQIPKRAFPSPEAAEVFLQAAKQWNRAAG